jgi:hypothetical protein
VSVEYTRDVLIGLTSDEPQEVYPAVRGGNGYVPGDVTDCRCIQMCAGSAGLRAPFVESKNHCALR